MRERQVNMIIGAPGHGKSTEMMNIIKAYPDKNVLIWKNFLNIDDPAFKSIPEKQYIKYTGGRAKMKSNDMSIAGKNEKQKYKNFMQGVIDHYRNGMLIVDDASNYEKYTTSDEFNNLIMMRRHIGVDVFYIYHGFTLFPIPMLPYVNNIILFHTADNFSYKGAKLPQMEKLQAAQERIAAQVAKGNKYYHEVIKLS